MFYSKEFLIILISICIYFILTIPHIFNVINYDLKILIIIGIISPIISRILTKHFCNK